MFLKIELLVDSEDPRKLADAINGLFNLKRARYTAYENGKVKDNLKEFCINCDPTEEK